jgi:hypothetical protein
VPEIIRIDAPTLEAARKLSDSLSNYNTRLLGANGEWAVVVERDREFNELLLGVLEVTDAYLGDEPQAALRLTVDGHTYPLHPPARA